MRTNHRRRLSCIALGTLLLLSGCLDFKKQTLIIKFDDKSDKITCMSVYEGFFVGGGLSKKSALASAKDGIDTFIGEKRSLYLFSNFLEIDLDPDPSDPGDVASLVRRLNPFIRLSRGALTLNERGELCGYKTLTINDAKGFEKVINELISEHLAKETDFGLSEESNRLLKRAARERHRWLRLSPGQTSLDIPMTAEDTDKTLEAFEESAKDKDAQATIAAIREAVGSFEITKTDGGLVVIFGDGKRRTMSIEHRWHDGQKPMEKELLEFAKTRVPQLDKAQTTKELIKTFHAKP